MPDCAFTNPDNNPTDAELKPVLGGTWKVWKELSLFLQKEALITSFEWKLMKSGWTLLPKIKTRTICYLFPETNQFTAGFVLGKKAVEAARLSELPAEVLNSIESARPYAEGRGIQVKITKETDLATLKLLVELKLAKH